ncbi:MAG: hypothetical protein ACOYOV_18120, partial [Bacteroidales bacterium]
MKITTEEFSKSFFNIGAGYDIQPLMRFTHVTDTFIYLNLYLSEYSMSDWYDSIFRESDFEVLQKEVVTNFDELIHFEISPNYRNHLIFQDFMDQYAYQEYMSAFAEARNLTQYAILYTLRRKSLNRIIKLYLITAEGLASYLVLSQNGLYAPKILCTIQTNILEHSRGIIDRLFSNPTRKKPDIWIRGFEPSRHYDNWHSLVNKNQYGLFEAKILDFNHQW